MTQTNIIETLINSYKTTKNVNEMLFNENRFSWEKCYNETKNKRHEIENTIITLYATGIINKKHFETALNEMSKIDGYNGD